LLLFKRKCEVLITENLRLTKVQFAMQNFKSAVDFDRLLEQTTKKTISMVNKTAVFFISSVSELIYFQQFRDQAMILSTEGDGILKSCNYLISLNGKS